MRCLCGVMALAVLAGLIGCGSGGDNAAPNPNGPTGGVIAGQLDGAAAPESYTILVNGTEMAARPEPDGSFVIGALPAGAYRVSFISPDGMEGARLEVTVVEGRTTPVGRVTTALGGQIVGMVMKSEPDGSLSPLAGVEVIADADMPWIVWPPEEPPGPPMLPDEDTPVDDSVAARPTQAPEPGEPRDGDAIVYRAFTDATGSFSMRAVAEGGYLVTVNVPGCEQGLNWVWVEPGRTAAADFQLRPVIEPGLATVQGTVHSVSVNGVRAPLEGAIVELFADGSTWGPVPAPPIMLEHNEAGFAPPSYWFEEFRTVTDAWGNYSLTVPAGYLNMTVWAEGYEAFFDHFALLAGDTRTLTITLQPWQDPWQGRELPPPVPLTTQ